MNPFLLLFSLITVISAVISVGIMLIRRKFGPKKRTQEDIRPVVFSFFTTLYAFFIGFAMVTLWTAFLTAKANVTREADAIMITYRTAKNLPESESFRQAIVDYVKSVINVEWPEMERGAMSEKANQHFEDIWSRLYELKGDSNKVATLYTNLTDAERERLSRASVLGGNLYPPVWVILFFGFISVIFGLYYINREQTVVSLVFEFMMIFLLLSCLYFIVDLDTPFSGLVNVKPEAFQRVYFKILSLP